MVCKRSFETEQEAQEFAKEVGGTIRVIHLPDNAGLVCDYVVEWEF